MFYIQCFNVETVVKIYFIVVKAGGLIIFKTKQFYVVKHNKVIQNQA